VTRHARARRRTPVRIALYVARSGYGALQLTSPGLVSGALLRRRPDARAQGVARVLGARQLGQALASGAAPSYPVLAVGVEVDLLHAASMLALALARRRRRAAFTDALIAGAFALAGALAAREAAHDPPRRPGNAVQELRRKWADRVAAACVPGYPARSGASRAHGTARFLTGSTRGTILPSGPSQKR
jgi:hypothetical protein